MKANAPTHAMLDKAAGSTLDYVLLDVDAQSFDPIRASWFYRNGSKIIMTIGTEPVQGKFRLPGREGLDMSIPHYHATAQVDYGTYQINIPIADATFAK